MQDAGFRILDAGFKMLDVGCRFQDSRCKFQDVGRERSSLFNSGADRTVTLRLPPKRPRVSHSG
jgi:hypothetical protein